MFKKDALTNFKKLVAEKKKIEKAFGQLDKSISDAQARGDQAFIDRLSQEVDSFIKELKLVIKKLKEK